MISKTFPAAPFAAAIVPMFGAACPSAIDDDNTQKKTFTEKKKSHHVALRPNYGYKIQIL